ncbi:uncharacterized protein [Antedon mediterranea]|uniref:uncharacterized protein n=1 Tax=Antedon mediterranea TaxID=105859 RepID=UPI003AF48976
MYPISTSPQNFGMYRQDRDSEAVGKSRGGGVCLLVNQNWCKDVKNLSAICTSQLEALTIRCRPFYLPRELTSLIITVVYIPPDANAESAATQLSTIVTDNELKHPNATSIILGDFNHVNLKKTLPKLFQHVTVATRNNNILDHCYTTIKDAYRSLKRPPLGESDHNLIYMIPRYRCQFKREAVKSRMISKWTPDNIMKLQGCFDCTDWNAFKDSSDINLCTESVISYIKFCQDICIDKDVVKIYPNQNPWFNKSIKDLIRNRDRAFRSNDKDLFRKSKYELRKGINKAKREYKNRLEEDISSGDSRELWKSLNKITNYKPKSDKINSNDDLPQRLNDFFSRFDTPPLHEDNNYENGNDVPLVVLEENTCIEFSRCKSNKSAGPDGISPMLVKHCCKQIAHIFTYIFNFSLISQIIPRCFKDSIIVPIPKRSPIETLNDYRPITLTSDLMKCFEHIVLNYLKAKCPRDLDQYQFAYRPNRSTEDAVSITLHRILEHLERDKRYARILYIDFSSAFNTIVPYKLHTKMVEIGFDISICNWVLNFLTDRPQRTKVGTTISDKRIINTGVPQGCVLSPFLFTLFTYDCVTYYSNCHIAKFADDTTIVGLINDDSDESNYRNQVKRVVDWCNENNLFLNVSKTKEMVVDFRKSLNVKYPIFINGISVEFVEEFKFLGQL